MDGMVELVGTVFIRRKKKNSHPTLLHCGCIRFTSLVQHIVDICPALHDPVEQLSDLLVQRNQTILHSATHLRQLRYLRGDLLQTLRLCRELEGVCKLDQRLSHLLYPLHFLEQTESSFLLLLLPFFSDLVVKTDDRMGPSQLSGNLSEKMNVTVKFMFSAEEK